MRMQHVSGSQPVKPVAPVFERDGYVEVHMLPGSRAAASEQARVDQIAAIVARHSAVRVLVVCEDPDSRLERDEAYWLGDSIARRLSQVRTAIAITARPLDEGDDFSARIARDRGAVVRYFDDVGAAERWLLDERLG